MLHVPHLDLFDYFFLSQSSRGLGFLSPMLLPLQARQLGRDVTKSVCNKVVSTVVFGILFALFPTVECISKVCSFLL